MKRQEKEESSTYDGVAGGFSLFQCLVCKRMSFQNRYVFLYGLRKMAKLAWVETRTSFSRFHPIA